MEPIMNRDRRIHQSGSSSFNDLFPRTSDAMSKNNYHDLGSMYNRRQDDRDASYSFPSKIYIFILVKSESDNNDD